MHTQVMTALSWAAFYGKRDIVAYFLSDPEVDATLKGVEGFFKGKSADEVAQHEGHLEMAASIAEVRTKQVEEWMRAEYAGRKEWVTEFLTFAGIPPEMHEEYAEALVKEGYVDSTTMALLDEHSLEKDFKTLKKAHRKLLLKAVAEIGSRDTPYCKAFFFQMSLLAVFCSLLVVFANPNVHKPLRQLGLIS